MGSVALILELYVQLLLPPRCWARCLKGEEEKQWDVCPTPVPLPRAPAHPPPVLSGFECVFCNFVCKTKNMFERHLQIHLITRMFECDVCHKFMKTPEQLLEHKKCHTVPTGGLK